MPTDFSDFIDSYLSCFSIWWSGWQSLYAEFCSFLFLDTLAPLKSRSVSFVCSASWYNDDLHAMKALCLKMERRWHMSGLSVHHQAWKDSLLEYKAETVSARSIYFSQIIVSNQRNPKQLFHSINKLLKNHSNVPASTHLSNTFLEFLTPKCIIYVTTLSILILQLLLPYVFRHSLVFLSPTLPFMTPSRSVIWFWKWKLRLFDYYQCLARFSFTYLYIFFYFFYMNFI